jgi:hypothetical protein
LTQIGAPFELNVPQAQNSFWTHPMVLLGDEAQVEARFSLSGDNANLDERYCTGCAEHTMALEIVLDAPDGTPRWHGSCGISFQSVRR